MNFRPWATSNITMRNDEPLREDDRLEETAQDVWSPSQEEEQELDIDLDPEALLAAEVGTTTVLTRTEEERLGRQIARSRKRVSALLKRLPRLVRAALPQGRGVVTPEDDFRERESVAILSYARQALKQPRLARAIGYDRKKLRAFVEQLSAALADYRAVRDQMLRANVRLVNVLARRYRHPTLTFLDMFQEGTLGLIRAIEKYDPERNIKFSTYATWWIWQQLGRTADTYGALVRTPVHWNQLRRRVHSNDAAGLVSRAEVAASEGMDLERFDTMAQAFHFISTDAPVGDDDDRTLEAILPNAHDDPEAKAAAAGLRRHLERALVQLPERDRAILQRRFGWHEDESETLEEIGSRLGISRERVRQIESRALKHLRDVCASQGLHEYLQ